MVSKKIIFFLLFLLFSNAHLKSQSNADYKSILIFSIAKYINWPEKSFKGGKFTIGILDKEGSAFRSIEEVVSFSTVPNTDRIRTRIFKSPSKVRPCQILFIAAGNVSNLDNILKSLSNYPCLIITEEKNLFEQGSGINFFLKENRWQFLINRQQMEKSGLTVDPSLDKLAYSEPKILLASTENINPKISDEKKTEELQLRNRIKYLEKIVNSGNLASQTERQKANAILKEMNLTNQEKDSIISVIETKKKLAEQEKERTEALRKDFIKDANAQLAQKDAFFKEQYFNIFLYSGIALFIISSLALMFFIDLQRRKKTIKIINKAKEELAEKVEEISLQKEEITKQRNEIENKGIELSRKNENIRNSIRAAKTIQEAMLPTIPLIRDSFPESFVFHRPREIVSGDFYWFAHIKSKPNYDFETDTKGKKSIVKGFTEQKFAIAAVDCTGHGVPGAFMSMIGNDLLNEVVHRGNLTEPDKILTEMHLSVRKALKQDETGNLDGMDMALCVIYKNLLGKIILEFAGARNPLVYIQNNELNELKANSFSIGGFQKGKDRIYTKQSIVIEQPTHIYIFSDGYKDQFGTNRSKRFSSESFKKLLLKIHKEPVLVQEQILEETLHKWMDGVEQMDDILVIGLKLDNNGLFINN